MFHSLQVITYKKEMLFHVGTYDATLNFIDFFFFVLNSATTIKEHLATNACTLRKNKGD